MTSHTHLPRRSPWLSRSLVFSLWLFFLSLGAALADPGALTTPPAQKPVHVKAGFYLLNLNAVNDRNETFDADIYLSFQWKDPRLAFTGTGPQTFHDTAVTDKLKEIWWPHIEYVNTSNPTITNQALEIFPDGTVCYFVGLSAVFRANLDLRRFPFDTQTLLVRIGSFYWTLDDLVFEPRDDHVSFDEANSYEGLRIFGVHSEVKNASFLVWGQTYSEFHCLLQVKRNYLFYLWTIFGPIILIFLISCAALYVGLDQFADRISICLTALLACIATQFAVSFSLPQIDYLTDIDRVFIITYFCVALNVLLSVWEVRVLKCDPVKCAKLDRIGRAGIPLCYFVLLIAAIIF